MSFTILLLINFTIGYIVQSGILNLILLTRSNLSKILIKKLINHDLSWLNHYLLLFILFYLLICTYLGLNTLYLEDVTLNVKLDDVNVSVSGQFLNAIFKNFGSAAVHVCHCVDHLHHHHYAPDQTCAGPRLGLCERQAGVCESAGRYG